MKYAIITFHNTLNCGACLQAYALCRFLRDNGIDCDILDYQCHNIVERELTFKKSSNFIKTIINYLLVWPRQKKMNSKFIGLLRNEKMLSDRRYFPNNIKDANDYYDGFITGSDQVWNLNITGNDYNFFLDFVDNSKLKIAFSASLGEQWDAGYLNKIKGLLTRYDAISLRESNSCTYIKEQFNIDSIHVCDPTMLLSSKDWAEIAATPQEKDYVLLYNPRSGVEKIAEEYAKNNGKKIIYIGSGKVHLRKNTPKTVTPQEWIGYIMNASAVFTDSYHGLLFSLYFNKPVWTLYNGTRGSRQTSLYKKLDIYDCVYTDFSSLGKTIDYQKCNSKIYHFRKDSSEILLNAIANTLYLVYPCRMQKVGSVPL